MSNTRASVAGSNANGLIGEPRGRRLWLSLVAVVIVAAGLQSYGMNKWPMADDEVLSLVTMGLRHVDAAMFSFPPDLLEKLPRAVPVWHAVQRRALGLLPDDVVWFRLPSVICGVLTSALVFLLAARWRGLWFAVAVSIALNGSPLFIHVAQINRFYSLPLLLSILALAAMWLPYGRMSMVLVTGLLALLTVLSHNVTVAMFGLAFVASCATYLLGTPWRVVVRSGAAFAVTGLVYLLYLLPLVRGWSTTGNPTQVLISFAAYAGVPMIALGLLGGWLSVTRRERGDPALWWVLVLAGSLCMFEVSTFSWNPRYFVFFLPALWMLAADAIHFVARKLNYGAIGAVWYASVVVLLLPNLLSHYQDGSRHDYRQAAAVVMAQPQTGQLILSDDAETIWYYLPAELRQRLIVRTKAKVLPASEFFLVARSNVWMPLPVIPLRRMDLLAEIVRRRYDSFSHIVRVYRVSASERQ
jgi:hypothetical protein